MASRIQILSSDVIDQIAAGEVVERPAHLVKELVENSIDAGATSIEVEYDQGGRRVRVTDNGSGIAPDDLPRAIARHGTSKISQAADLWALSSFGFRGEALASIGAVSRLSLQSRTAEASSATVLVCEHGRVAPPAVVGGNKGTTVLVEELFANVPARLKFLKSEAGESAQIKATLRALALANESIEFRIRTGGKVVESWPARKTLNERAQELLGALKLYAASGDYENAHAEIAFASPHDVGGNARGIQIFVQGRWVQDRSLQSAVIDAYRGLLMHGEFPIAIVRLTIAPEDVDVNIHPTKSAVKFRDPQIAFRAVNRTLRAALEQAPWLAHRAEVAAAQDGVTGRIESGEANSHPDRFGDAASVAARMQAARDAGRRASTAASEETRPGTRPETPTKKMSIADLTRPYQAAMSDDAVGEGAKFSNGADSRASTDSESSTRESLATAPLNSVGRFDSPEFDTIQFKQKSDLHPTTETEAGTPDSQPNKVGAWSRLQVLGQANLTYILAQDANRLVMIDQHAAHERVTYEKLMKAWLGGQAESQPLLIPITIELEPDGAEALMSIAGELEKLGLQIDQNGPQSIALRSLPLTIKETSLTKALKELASEISEKGGGFALEKKISDLCATMACHSVVRAGQALSHDQMRKLLQQMDEFPLSSFCPHGRPVSVDYPYSKLERDFGRTV
jgi:DNA mismatch repair protein MutL